MPLYERRPAVRRAGNNRYTIGFDRIPPVDRVAANVRCEQRIEINVFHGLGFAGLKPPAQYVEVLRTGEATLVQLNERGLDRHLDKLVE